MASKTDFNLQNFFPYQVRIFYRDVIHIIRDIYHSKYGLTMDEWRTMANLNEFEPLSAKEIVLRSSIGKVNVSRAIASLKKRDFLERHVDPTDRRRILLRLTPQGRKVMAELIPLVKEAEKEITSSLTPEEHETLIRLMEKVRQNVTTIEMDEDD